MPQCLSLQVYFQRVLSARTTRFADILSYIAGAGCTFITIPAMLIGIIATQTSMYLMYYFFKSDLILFVFLLIIYITKNS